MRIASVRIENIKGIASAEFPVGSLTIVQGRNGSGKTSILDAIKAAFEGGHNPELIRQGAKSGVVVIALDNGTTITTKITAKGTTREIVTADGLKVAKPAAWLEKLASGFSFDPLAFLEAPPKARAQFLLEAMPITFSPDEIASATGQKPSQALNLDQFQQFRQGVYDERTQANGAAKAADGTVTSLQQTLPEHDQKDWPAAAQEARDKQANLRAELSRVSEDIKRDADAAIAAQASIRDAAIAAAKQAYEEARAEIVRMQASATAEATAEIQAELETVSADLAMATERADAQRKAAGIRQQIEKFSSLWRESMDKVDALTRKLAALDELKKSKLAAAAIPGVEVIDGRVMVDGVSLDHLNTQRQYFVAFQIASLKAGELGFMLADRAESIVGDEWDAFRAAAAESGFQVLCARATEGQGLSVIPMGANN